MNIGLRAREHGDTVVAIDPKRVIVAIDCRLKVRHGGVDSARREPKQRISRIGARTGSKVRQRLLVLILAQIEIAAIRVDEGIGRFDVERGGQVRLRLGELIGPLEVQRTLLEKQAQVVVNDRNPLPHRPAIDIDGPAKMPRSLSLLRLEYLLTELVR